ncbi:uncharacterized protein PITG_11903 [Phytophthora infestans T30-4]|uniref:Uncharacterized protein n=4 Tax=Phytophthora infestans TaxID=4787 RepID=D0NHH9_PHYIT|nr:uncharacterized protein PITG_11903 [Phytophthora infestans T30-4]EEY58904.1 conserved hypothetical protein [Phytophthora infestans T30-4]KAF4038357.1 hypothetical protein GN244_ATG09528 [Phytophthora infestans]KAI9990677.1 hypothetical protein PInf_018234 [Phytophthora infestans]|eukprot:XP_002901377.1 conserved hypothetical protein [Phytophthora infestans T30-4]
MLSAKLLVATVSLGLAVTTSDVSATRLRVRVHTKSTTTCGDGEQTIGVAGWDHDGCVASSNVCVAQVSDGECPDGAYCALLDTGVYGCTAGDDYDDSHETTSYCAEGEQTIGVAGWDHDGCVATGNVCVAQVSDGACPDGASCALLDTGVYGCTAGDGDDESWDSHETTSYCAKGEQTIGVAGWDHDGCVATGNVCVAQVSDGECPHGAYCALLDTGVYGCTAGSHENIEYVDDGACADNEETIGVVGWDHDGCIESDHVCVAQVSDGDCPSGASCSLLDTDVYGCVANAKKHHRHHHHNQKVTCPGGQQSIGVAGWSSDGCVASGNVCVAETHGDCPSGAHCAWLDTGVYGCHDGAEESTPWEGCSSYEQSIGVVGWDQDGCIDSDHVCVAQVSDGDCPSGAYCSLLDTGVYGCVASAKKHHHHHHHHHHKENQKVACPSGQQSIGVAGWSSDGCVASGNVCVAETHGDCPSGAHCAWLDTGVYGCQDGAQESTPWEGCSSYEQTIGVVGWDQDGCIDSDHVCVAQVSDGDCPSGAYCSLLDTGVYGCVASSKKLL